VLLAEWEGGGVVVKQTHTRMRVAADWEFDRRRVFVERDCLELLSRIAPGVAARARRRGNSSPRPRHRRALRQRCPREDEPDRHDHRDDRGRRPRWRSTTACCGSSGSWARRRDWRRSRRRAAPPEVESAGAHALEALRSERLDVAPGRPDRQHRHRSALLVGWRILVAEQVAFVDEGAAHIAGSAAREA
jgi:hypothetical protein